MSQLYMLFIYIYQQIRILEKQRTYSIGTAFLNMLFTCGLQESVVPVDSPIKNVVTTEMVLVSLWFTECFSLH